MKSLPALAIAAVLLVTGGCGAGSSGATPSVSPSAVSTVSPSPATSAEPSAATPTPSVSRTATPTPTPTEPAADATVAVTVADGKVSPSAENVRLEQGQTVRFTLTSDDPAESIHIHGYDKTIQAKAGKTTTLDLVADQRGAFEVETHETAKLVVKLIVA